MKLSQQQLDKINEYAKALTPVPDVAYLLGVDVDEMRYEMTLNDSEAHRAYERGRAQTMYEIRAAEINMAANGSPMAIQQVKSYINDLIIKNDL